MGTLRVNLNERSYDIVNEAGVLHQCGAYVAPLLRGKRCFVVSDTNVAPRYGDTVLHSLADAGLEATLLTIPAGERSKTPERLAWLWEQMAQGGVTRTDAVIALGGGVVGDLAGFAAATMLRGVDFIQIPTTLLAQVDSSVGGKVAVDLMAGKNLAGAFYQPKLVLMDPETLTTLPDRVFADGMAEVIKYGCIWDEALFAKLERLGSRSAVMGEIIDITTACCDIKRQVVEQDELDLGIRMILNFGHTLGHVYEKAYHYETYTHGEAVAAGMVAAAKLGQRLGHTPVGTDERITALLAAFGLPTAIEADRTVCETVLGLDKKNQGKTIHFIFLERLGKALPVAMDRAALLAQL